MIYRYMTHNLQTGTQFEYTIDDKEIRSLNRLSQTTGGFYELLDRWNREYPTLKCWSLEE